GGNCRFVIDDGWLVIGAGSLDGSYRAYGTSNAEEGVEIGLEFFEGVEGVFPFEVGAGVFGVGGSVVLAMVVEAAFQAWKNFLGRGILADPEDGKFEAAVAQGEGGFG